jgi:hypothetical protein
MTYTKPIVKKKRIENTTKYCTFFPEIIQSNLIVALVLSIKRFQKWA